MSHATEVNLTNYSNINGLLWGWRWADISRTYSFPQDSAIYTVADYVSVEGFSGFGNAQQQAARNAFNNLQNFSNLTFTEVVSSSPQSDHRLALSNATTVTNDRNIQSTEIGRRITGTAWAAPPELSYRGTAPKNAERIQGDTWYNSVGGFENPEVGTYAHLAIFHELGHAMGLKHGHAAQSGHGVLFPAAQGERDSRDFTVMTYNSFPNSNRQTAGINSPTSYMQDDIAAIQFLYGANYGAGSNNTNTVYTWNKLTGEMSINGLGQGNASNTGSAGNNTPANIVYMTLWDGGGEDVYDFSNYSTNTSLDLRPGKWLVFDGSSSHLQRANLSLSSASPYWAAGNVANALTDPNNPNDNRSLIENVIGGTGNDFIIGNRVANDLHGSRGNDIMYGQEGGDSLFGEDGNDRLYGDQDNDFLRGGVGDDLIDGGAGIDRASYVDAESGVAVDLRNTGYQAVGGGRGSDKLANIENIIGSNYNDSLSGNDFSNTLDGGDGSDSLYGYGGNDSLYGGDGNDLLRGGVGNDDIYGGDGVDKISFALATGAITVSLLIEQSQAIGGGEGSDKIVDVEDVLGSRFNDTITGNESANTIEGNDGNDIIFGRGGADYILGGAGNDLIRGGSGNDRIDGGQGTDRASYIDATSGVIVNLTITTSQNVGGGLGSDTITEVEDLLGSGFDDDLTGSDAANVIDGDGGNDDILALSGNDTIYGRGGNDRMRGGAGNDFIDGGEGIDRASFYDATSGIAVDLRQSGYQNVGGGLGSDKLLNIENILGGLFNDLITGNSTANQLEGDNGDDSIFGLEGNDRLYGGNGNDLLRGGAGDDLINGGADSDRASFSDATSGISVDLRRADAQFIGVGLGSDTLVDIEDIVGGRFNDVITGNVFANSIDGGEGNDTISGGGGNDFLVGGRGADTLEGGEGNDVFVFGSTDSSLNLYDRITDFAVGQDKISLVLIDANTSRAGDQSFTFIGEQSFSALTPGQLRFAQGFLYGNWNNDTIADFKIQVDTAGIITSSDFYL